MRNDYKSHSDLFGAGSQRRPRLGLLALAGLAVSATALYVLTSTSTPETAQTTPRSITISDTETVVEEVAIPEVHRVALELPSPMTAGEPASTTVQKTPSEIATESGQPLLQPMLHPEPVADSTHQAKALPIQEHASDATETGPADSILSTPVKTGAPDVATISELSALTNQDKWLEEKVKQGDSLARIFSRLDLSANLLHRIVNSSKEAKELANIRPGETIRVRLDTQGELRELVHQQSRIRSLRILPDGEGFSAKILDRNLETRIATASGTITNSLYLSAQRAGLSDALTMELANIFGWDIDFALEIRAGDQFSLIYEEEYLDGEKFRNGAILAAEFINQGKVFRAIRFEDDEGYANYYSPEGESMRKAFLRAPVDFRRISSRFTKARYHPVLGKKRPHRGVDYAAAIGTPIKASGDGRVTFRGTKGGYGRTIMIRHGSQYTTLYAHMSKFRGSVKQGSRVRQGQVIGYVGKSGLATGPHLHYEFRVNGVHRNPLTIKLPAAEPLKKQYRTRFAEVSSPLISQLDLISKTMVADAR